MKLALSFAPNGWPTALEFRALGHGITPPANDPAASGGQGQLHINNVNVTRYATHDIYRIDSM